MTQSGFIPFDERIVDTMIGLACAAKSHRIILAGPNSFEMFLERVGNHPRCCILFDPSHFVLQQLDYLEYIDIYHDRIKVFHVKDAEFNPTGRQGVYGGFQPWINRAGRFRSLGDGQVDFSAIFSKLAQYDFPG